LVVLFELVVVKICKIRICGYEPRFFITNKIEF